MTSPAKISEPDPCRPSAREWVLLPEEARARGFKNALAFKRWCLRHRVAIRRDGRMLWVRPGDVDKAVGVLPIRSATPAVISAVEAIKARCH